MGGTMSSAKAAAVIALGFTTDDQLSPPVRRAAVFRAARAKLVFGATPTLKEAQESISDLWAYLSPDNSIGYNCSDLQHPALLATSQDDVASIVCDPNVYNAMLQNPEFRAFLLSLSMDLSGTSMDPNPEFASDCDPLIQSFPIDGLPTNGLFANHSQLQSEASFPNTQKKTSSETPPPTDWFQGIYRWLQGIFESLKDMYQKMKDVVVGIMTDIFHHFKKLFRDTWDAMVGMMNYIFDYLKKLFPGTSDAVVGMMINIFDYLKKLFRDSWDALVGIMNKYIDYRKNLVGCMCDDKLFVDEVFVEVGALGLIGVSVIVIVAILLKRRYPHFKGYKAYKELAGVKNSG